MIWNDDLEETTGISREEKYGRTNITYVDIVRCKDCKYALDVHDRANQFSCIAPQASEYCHDADFFCADGRRKSE